MSFHRSGCAGLAALLATAVAAQTPPPPVDPLAAKAQLLIDDFIRVMPRDPTQLRSASVRRELHKTALPALRAIVAFVQAHADSSLADRGLEFSIYAVAIGDEAVRDGLRERAATDASAELMLQSAAVISAADGKARAAALEGVARGLGARPKSADGDAPDPAASALPKPSRTARNCAVQCLVVAAQLDETELRQLADGAEDEHLGKRLREAAESAAKDPRKLLDKPFVLEGKLVDGEPFTTAALRGKVVLVDFWASWCVPCVRTLPELVACQRKYAAQGLVIVGVSCDRERAALTGFLAKHAEVDWPQLFDPPAGGGFHPAAQAAGVTSIPRLFLIDRSGILRSIDAHDELENKLAALLGG